MPWRTVSRSLIKSPFRRVNCCSDRWMSTDRPIQMCLARAIQTRLMVYNFLLFHFSSPCFQRFLSWGPAASLSAPAWLLSHITVLINRILIFFLQFCLFFSLSSAILCPFLASSTAFQHLFSGSIGPSNLTQVRCISSKIQNDRDKEWK